MTSIQTLSDPDWRAVARWQLADLTDRERSILSQLPPLGTDPSGPLGPGLLSRGVLGSAIREIQAQISRGIRPEDHRRTPGAEPYGL